jgi:predicted nucleic acid-binding protein
LIVIDASAFVDALAERTAVIERISGEELHAPHMIDLEVANALRRFSAAGKIDGPGGRRLLTLLADVELHRHSHYQLLGSVWELRYNLSAYDAVYVALATALDAPLVTTDRKLAATPNLTCVVELV